MQEILNPLKSATPVQATDFSSNAKLEPRSARSDSFQKSGQSSGSNKNLNQATKSKSTTNTQSTNTQQLTKNTNGADETTDSKIDSFDKTLTEQSSNKKSTDDGKEINKEEVKKITKEVLDALIAFIQQTQIAQVQQTPELKDSINTAEQGFIISQNIDIAAVADTLSVQNNILDTELELAKTTTAEHTNSPAINSLLQNYANEISLSSSGDSETTTPISELVNQLLNSPELAAKSPELKAVVLNEVVSALSDKLERMQEMLNKQIENINISDISLEKIALDSETQLPKLNPELEAKLDQIIKLGDKNEQVTKLLEVSSALGEELNAQLKNINKTISDLGDDETKSIKTEILQLLGNLDSEFKIEVDFKQESLGNDESLSSIGSESIQIDQTPLNSDSQNKDNNLLFHKEVKLNHRVSPENINTAMKAAELVRTLPDLVRDTNPNSSRELKIKLNPEELGTVDVTISKNADQQISIQLSVTNEAAEETLKHKISELTAALGDKGVSISDINISKSSSGNLNDKNPEGKNSFNEGREEQKKRQESNQRQQDDRTKDQYSFQTELFSILR
ncbi:MAG: flagellar hook-length control protein FliK [Candidatus Melainabacteria bacterium]|nr:flagellar hook-length control protein FliK [Candidatus Melainabacteria bacterium]